MRVGVLGPLTVNGEIDELSPRDRVVLSALAVSPGRHVSVGQLADALWGAEPPASANKVVQGCVSRLRHALGATAIETSTHGYRLTFAPDDIDHPRFGRLVAEARDLLARGEFDRAASRLDDALGLWRGDPLRDLEEWEPARADTARLHELHAEAEELRVDALIRSGRHDEVLADARGLVDNEPTREQRWALLARAQYLAGQQGPALDTLQRARRALVEQLGVEPGQDLRRLELLILQQDPELDVAETASSAGARCPYPGLAHFDIDDADDFFGRDQELAAALLRLRRDGVLVVVGPSGSGKSSLVRAGIAATLRREGLPVIVRHPAGASDWLQDPPAPAGALLVVDQLEEIFSLDDPTRSEVAARLVAHRTSGPIVATLRADRIAELAGLPAVSKLFRRSLHLIGPMNEIELREAISAPALRAGLLLEPGLADLLVHELAGEPGALPLLSHALRATWSHREGRTLTVDGYRATGGVQQAINTSAESVFDDLDDSQQRALRTIALRLVTPAGDGEPTRRRVSWETVAPDPLRQALVERLVQARLLTSEDDAVTLAHEAVARAWPRLRRWLEEDAESHRLLGHLTTQAEAWQAMGRPDAELYRGGRLAAVHDWRQRDEPDLTGLEREFLDASTRLADAERAAIADRLDAQTRSNRRLRLLLLGVTIALVAAAISGGVALRQRARASDSAREADAARVGALALSTEDVDYAMLLAVEAVRTHESDATRGSLMTVLGRTPGLIGSAVLDGPAVAADVSDDGRFIAVGGPLHGLALLDADSLDPLAATAQPVASVSFSPDGELVAVGTNRYTPVPGETVEFEPGIVVYHRSGLRPAARQPELPYPGADVPDIGFASEAPVLAAVLRRARLVVWDTGAMGTPTLDIGLRGEPWRIALAPDGTVAYVGVAGSSGVFTQIISLIDGTELGVLPIAGDGIAISDDGAILALSEATRNSSTTVVLYDTASLDEVGRLEQTGTPAAALAFSPTGRYLALTDRSATAVVWDRDTGLVTEEFSTPSGAIWALDFAADGSRLVTTGLDRRVHLWDLEGDSRTIRRQNLPLRASSEAVVVDPGGRYGVAVSYSTLEVFDLDERYDETHEPPPVAFIAGGVRTLAWHPTEPGRLVVGTENGVVQERDAATNEVVAEHRIGSNAVTAVSWTASGSSVAYGTASGEFGVLNPVDGTTVVFDVGIEDQIVGVEVGPAHAVAVTTRPEIVVLDLANGSAGRATLDFVPVRSALDPHGRRLVVVGAGGETGLLDVSTGEWVRETQTVHDDIAFSASFAPDGSTFVTGGSDGRIVIWDAADGSVSAIVRLVGPPHTVVPTVLDDSVTIVAGSTDGSIHRWSTDTTSLIEQACSVARRDLTPSEWSDVLGRRNPEPVCS